MQKTVAAADLGKRFRAVFNEVTEDHVPYVVTRDQQPEAVLVVRQTRSDWLRCPETLLEDTIYFRRSQECRRAMWSL